MIKEARFWKGNGSIQCSLCPHNCVIPDGRRGICGVRENNGGKLYSLIYASASSVHPDPIEKKPLFHFHPGSYALSFGTAGCNLRCLHCQNYGISQAKPEDFPLIETLPEEAIQTAKRRECDGIAWTYNEPTIWWEYTYDTSKIAKREGLYTAYVTNGFTGEDAIREISPYLDAANVDIKSMSDEFYKKVCGARLQPVLDSCVVYRETGIHLEVTYLIIPIHNDSKEEIKKFLGWVGSELGYDIPIHFSAFFPDYKMRNISPTSIETLLKAYGIASDEAFNYVYLGNVPHGDYEDTFCPSCGNRLIERHGFSAKVVGLEDEKCSKCGEKIPIVV